MKKEFNVQASGQAPLGLLQIGLPAQQHGAHRVCFAYVTGVRSMMCGRSFQRDRAFDTSGAHRNVRSYPLSTVKNMNSNIHPHLNAQRLSSSIPHDAIIIGNDSLLPRKSRLSLVGCFKGWLCPVYIGIRWVFACRGNHANVATRADSPSESPLRQCRRRQPQ